MDAKRQKLSHPTVDDKTTKFLEMNDDCIYKIFEYLDLDAICSMSEMCSRLKYLTTDYFQRKYADKLMHGLRVTTAYGQIQLQPNEQCAWIFSQCFDSVVFNLNHRRELDKVDLPAFIRKHCSEYLSSIVFQQMFLYQTLGDSIENVLQNVETVVFSECELEGDYHEILKHCHNLKYLMIDEKYGHKIENLLLETYPKLEQFSCRYYGRLLLTNNLKQFLRQHPNLKQLTWCFHARIREPVLSDETWECVDMIVKNGISLQELFLSFDGLYDLETISEKLKELYDRNHFKRLELEFKFVNDEGYKVTEMMYRRGHHLTKLDSLQGLHLSDFSDFGRYFLDTLCTMENLRILHLDAIVAIKKSILNSVALKGLSSLEELHVDTLYNTNLVQNFVCQVKSLKVVSIVNCECSYSRLEIPKLNLERKKLGGCKLIIYLKFNPRKSRMNSSCDDDLVKMELVNFQENMWNFNNPFIRMINTKP